MPQSIRVESVDDLPDLTVTKKGLPVPADIKNQEVREEPGYGEEFLQSYEKVATPLWEGPSRGARAVTGLPDRSKEIAESVGLGKPYETWRGAQETGLELAGDIASSQTAPLNLAMLIPDIASMGASRLGRQGLATGLRYAAKPAAGAVVGKGVYDVVDPESTMSERAVGTFNALLGAASIGRGRAGGTRELHAKNVTPDPPLRLSDGPDSFRQPRPPTDPVPDLPLKQLPVKQEPNLTKRPLVLNNDGTFTDKNTGEIIDRNGKVVGDSELDLRPVNDMPPAPPPIDDGFQGSGNLGTVANPKDFGYAPLSERAPVESTRDMMDRVTANAIGKVRGVIPSNAHHPDIDSATNVTPKFTTADEIIQEKNAGRHTIEDLNRIANRTGDVDLYHGTTAENADAITSEGVKLPQSGEEAARSVAAKYGIPWMEWKTYVEPQTTGAGYGEQTRRLSTAPGPIADRWSKNFPQGEILSDLNAKARMWMAAKAQGRTKDFDAFYDEVSERQAAAGGSRSLYEVPDHAGIGADDLMKPSGRPGQTLKMTADARAIPERHSIEARRLLDRVEKGEITPEEAVEQWNNTYRDIKVAPQNIKNVTAPVPVMPRFPGETRKSRLGRTEPDIEQPKFSEADVTDINVRKQRESQETPYGKIVTPEGTANLDALEYTRTKAALPDEKLGDYMKRIMSDGPDDIVDFETVKYVFDKDPHGWLQRYKDAQTKRDLAKAEVVRFPNQPDPDEPTFQKTGAGKLIIGTDVKRSSGELTTGYSGPLPGIMNREAGQNAIDAMRALGIKGNLDVQISDHDMVMTDNGKGMTREDVFTVMSDLHSSGKATEAGATGGKGVGKASYMLGGKSFQLDTVAVDKDGRKYRTTVDLTPEQVVVNQADLLVDPNLGVDVVTVPVPDSTPTGTRIRTEFKDSQKSNKYVKDTLAGASARNMFRDIVFYSRGIQGNVSGNFAPKDTLQAFEWKDPKLDTVVSQGDFIKNGTSEIDLIIPQKTGFKERTELNLIFLNEGMFQFKETITIPKTGDMPDELLVNVKPKVDEGTDDYPFPLQRESVKDEHKAEIVKLIKDKLVDPRGEKRQRDLMKLWADMTPLSAISGNREVVLYDPGARLTPSEVGVLQQSIPLLQLAEKFDDTINQILGYSGRPEWENRVVRVGITLDPNMHGVHIPNPGATKVNGRSTESAILINPFITISQNDPRTAAFDLMVTQLHEAGHVGHEDVTITKFREEDLNDPRVGPFLVSLVKEGEQHGGNSLTGHGHDWTNRLGEIYARYGTKRFLQAADEIESIIGWQGHSGRYSPEVQGLLSLYQSSRGRDATIEDILSGTGVRQENASGGKKVLPSNVEGSGTGTTKRTRGSSRLQLGEDLEYAKLRVPILLAKKRLNVSENKELGRLVAHYKKDLLSSGGGGTVPPTGGGGNVPPTGPIEPKKPKKESEISVLRNVWNLSRGIMSTDLPFITSFALRQGKRHIGTGPWFKGWYDSVKAYGSEVAFKANDKVLRDTHKDIFRPTIEVRPDKVVNGRLIPGLKQSPIELAGVRLIDLDGPLTNRDEQIRSQWAERIPLLGRHIRASNRGYAAFGNALRVGAFENLYYAMAASGQTPNRNIPALKAMGDWVNNTTGSGKLATRVPFRDREFSLERYAKPLGEILFSPRLIADNLQSFNPYNYFGMPKGMRLKYWETSARLAAAWMTVAVTAKLAGAEVGLDPDSADFGKIKIGNLRLDPAGGLQQFLVLAHRMGSGEVVSSTTGRTRKMGAGGPYDPTVGSTIGDFVKNKLHPSAAFLAEFATATKKQPFGLGDQLLQSFTPMILQDLAELSAKDAYYKILFAPLVSAGWGTQTYDRTSMRTGKFIAPKNDLTYEGKGLGGQ